MKWNRQSKRYRKAKKEARQAGLVALVASSLAVVSIAGTVWFLIRSVEGSKHVHIDLTLLLVEFGLLCVAVWTTSGWIKARAHAKRVQEGPEKSFRR